MNTPVTPTSFWPRFRVAVRLFLLALRLTWDVNAAMCIGLAFFLLLQAVVPLVTLVLTRAIINRVASFIGLDGSFSARGLASSLPFIIGCTALVIILGQVSDPIVQCLQGLASDRVTVAIGQRLIAATNQWHGLARFEDPTIAADLARVRAVSQRAGLTVLQEITFALIHLGTAIGATIVLLHLNALAPLVFIVAALPAVAQRWEFIYANSRHLYTQTTNGRRLEYFRAVTLAPEVAQDIRLFALVGYFRHAYNHLFATVEQTFVHTLGRSGRRLFLASSGVALAFAALSVFTWWRVLQHQLGIGDLVLYIGTLALLQSELYLLANASGDIAEAFHFLPSLFAILHAPPDLPMATHPLPVPHPIQQGIVFDHVGFTYPGQSEPTLVDVSFSLGVDECVALVGLNGAGKTTLVKLLLRLYDPTQGRILLDGVDLQAYDLQALRRQMSALFQDFARYDLTVAENVGLGNVEQRQDLERIQAALHLAQADTFIAGLPEGVATPVGRVLHERDLSGGEWQKVAFARAFLSDAPVLILDEPTAALDAEAEYAIYQQFAELTRSRMTLLISHRFATVRMATRIVYLASGCIQEVGDHASLMARQGEYARLYQLQAERFVEKDLG